MNNRKFLILGSGGREHALCWHLKKFSAEVECAPGSDGIAEICPIWNFSNFEDLYKECVRREISDIIVGPEAYLAEGIANFFADKEISLFGPTKEAAQLETDKAYSKEFCIENEISTAQAIVVKKSEDLEEALHQFVTPFVVKATGLAAGKGVLVTTSFDEAVAFGKEWLAKSHHLVVEEFKAGQEVSAFYMVEDDHYCFIGAAQDHKRLYNDDKGPNTGGMGSYGPPTFFSEHLLEQIETQILKPSLNGLKKRGIHYRGFLFLGLMVKHSEISLIEYNCRMGDPETQSIVLRLKTPLPEILDALRDKNNMRAEFETFTTLNVVVASRGYPLEPQKGFSLGSLDQLSEPLQIFHSGTKRQNGEWVANGGRLFSVAISGVDVPECRENIYPSIRALPNQEKIIYRTDIGFHSGGLADVTN